MADLNTSQHDQVAKGPGVSKSKKMSTRVDLTPMVDLGFLLITFFMFTTTISHPTSMVLKMPDDHINVPPQDIRQAGALTILLGAKNKLYYYEGKLQADLSNVGSADYTGIRQVILAKKAAMQNPDDLFIIVMPGNNCTYKNIVDILDEFSIDLVERYALVNKVAPTYASFITKMDAVSAVPVVY